MSEFIEFSIHSPERFAALQRAFAELKHDKNADTWRPRSELMKCFDAESLRHFHWFDEKERTLRLEELRTRPIAIAPTEESTGQAWDFDSLIFAFRNGEYMLVDCEMTEGEKGRLTFSAFSDPYGGVGCMVALVEAFGCNVTGIDDGAGYFPVDGAPS